MAAKDKKTSKKDFPFNKKQEEARDAGKKPVKKKGKK